MKLHFDDNLDYQQDAIKSITDLFSGQDINRTEFTVSKLIDPTGQLKLGGYVESNLGIGNRLQLQDNEILDNLRQIQLRNGLRPSDSLVSGDFTVEMETGGSIDMGDPLTVNNIGQAIQLTVWHRLSNIPRHTYVMGYALGDAKSAGEYVMVKLIG